MDPDRLLARIRRGHLDNVAFRDLCRLAEAVGFVRLGQEGSHVRFSHRAGARLNIQAERGRAKPYQLRQILQLIERYALTIEDRS